MSSFTNAAGRAGRSGPTLPRRWAFVGHSAGGEAVAYVTNRIRTNHAGAYARLGGIVLEDPVNSFIGSNLSDALGGPATSNLSVLTLAFAPELPQQQPVGHRHHPEARQPVVPGAQVTTARTSTCSAPAPGRSCARPAVPQTKNVNAVQTSPRPGCPTRSPAPAGRPSTPAVRP